MTQKPSLTAAAQGDAYAVNGGVKIHYVVGGEGPLVVMIHGFPDYWATWKPLMGVLQAAGQLKPADVEAANRLLRP